MTEDSLQRTRYKKLNGSDLYEAFYAAVDKNFNAANRDKSFSLTPEASSNTAWTLVSNGNKNTPLAEIEGFFLKDDTQHHITLNIVLKTSWCFLDYQQLSQFDITDNHGNAGKEQRSGIWFNGDVPANPPEIAIKDNASKSDTLSITFSMAQDQLEMKFEFVAYQIQKDGKSFVGYSSQDPTFKVRCTSSR